MSAAAIEQELTATTRGLDLWYRSINGIYLRPNLERTAPWLLSRLVEASGGLSLAARAEGNTQAQRPFAPKALAWWFALCGKTGVRSVETMLWAKYPYRCAYCQKNPHQEPACRNYRATHRAPDWEELERIGDEETSTLRPSTLPDWIRMFVSIYELPGDWSFERRFARLVEELGELAESLRLFPIAPHYFLNEAADVFAWLLNCFSRLYTDGRPSTLEQWPDMVANDLWKAYPDTCGDCGNEWCRCDPIPNNVGRLAAEGPARRGHFHEGGAFLPASEMLETAQLARLSVRVDGEAIPADEALRALRTALPRIEGELRKLHLSQAEGFVETLKQVQRVVNLQTAQDTRVDDLESHLVLARAELKKLLNGLPDEEQERVIDYFSGFSSGMVSGIVLKLFGIG